MTNIYVTGATFNHRDTLKRYGAQWDSEERRWFFPRGLRPFEIDEIRRLVGCMVVEVDTPKPFNALQAIDSYIAKLTERDNNRQDGRHRTIMYGDDERYFNYFKDINPRSFFGFSSLAKMVDYIKAIPEEKRTGRRHNGFATGNAATRFKGSQSMGHALTIMDSGWPEGIEQAAEVLDMIGIEHATARRRSYGVSGGTVSVGRLLAGNPLHMVKRPRQPGRRIVTLFLETSVSSDIKLESMIARGAVIAAISDVLERQGYSCEIVNVDSTKDFTNRPIVQIATTLKQAGETLNLPDMIFALAHPSYSRRFCFACVCSADELRDIWEDQGRASVAFSNEHRPARSEFYLPNLATNPDGETLREKAAIILKSLEPLNLPLKLGKEKER